MTIKTTRLEPGRPLGTSNLSWGGTMFRTGRFSAPGLAGILVAALAAAGCSSQAGPAPTTENVVSASAAPSVLTSAALLIDGDAPRLLLAADGPLRPMVYAREGSKTLVVDLPGTVATTCPLYCPSYGGSAGLIVLSTTSCAIRWPAPAPGRCARARQPPRRPR